MFVLKDAKLVKYSAVSSHVPILKQEVRRWLITRKQLFRLLQETNKQMLPGHMPFALIRFKEEQGVISAV